MPRQVDEWLSRIDPAREALVEALGEGENPHSSSECIFLAIPFMSYQPNSIKAIDSLIDDFVKAVDAMGRDARQVLAEYGRRWEVTIATAVPVGQSCSIKLTEKRPWVGTFSPVLRQTVPFGDAMSTHIEVRSAGAGAFKGVGRER